MLRKWHIAITLVGVISVLLAGAWFYYFYAPRPVMPQLSAAAMRARTIPLQEGLTYFASNRR